MYSSFINILLLYFYANNFFLRFILFFILFFGHAMRHVESYFPDQRSNQGPLQWKRGVLTTGPPGKSLCASNFIHTILQNVSDLIVIWMYHELFVYSTCFLLSIISNTAINIVAHISVYLSDYSGNFQKWMKNVTSQTFFPLLLSIHPLHLYTSVYHNFLFGQFSSALHSLTWKTTTYISHEGEFQMISVPTLPARRGGELPSP